MPPTESPKSDAPEQFVASNQAAWNRAALAYQHQIQQDVAFLRDGGVSLSADERRILGDLAGVDRAIHLQCSHGLDALSLLNMGVREVVGVDISRAMLDQAEQKTHLLGSAARWVESDVASVPDSLNGTADLVYTGKGALPWMHDLNRWAGVVIRLLKPGGRLFVHEGHPLNWVWDNIAPTHALCEDGRGYFDHLSRANHNFPASAIARFTPTGQPVAVAWERQWTLGQVLTAIASVGLHIERVEEHASHFWNQFPGIAMKEMERLPHTYSITASLPAA